MNDAHNIQNLLAGLQQQIASISSLAGTPQYQPPTPQHTASDIQAIVRATLVEELNRLIPPAPAPALAAPAAPAVASVDLAPIAAPAPVPATTAPDLSEAMLKDFLNKLRISIGAGLTLEQQEWLSSHLFDLPDFFKSAQGKASLTKVMVDYKAYLG